MEVVFWRPVRRGRRSVSVVGACVGRRPRNREVGWADETGEAGRAGREAPFVPPEHASSSATWGRHLRFLWMPVELISLNLSPS